MGHNAIMGVIEMTGANDTALAWHLQSNHFPPIPLTMLQPCKDAIDACNEGDYEREIILPGEVTYRGKNHAPAYQIVEAHHLDLFIDWED